MKSFYIPDGLFFQVVSPTLLGLENPDTQQERENPAKVRAKTARTGPTPFGLYGQDIQKTRESPGLG